MYNLWENVHDIRIRNLPENDIPAFRFFFLCKFAQFKVWNLPQEFGYCSRSKVCPPPVPPNPKSSTLYQLSSYSFLYTPVYGFYEKGNNLLKT